MGFIHQGSVLLCLEVKRNSIISEINTDYYNLIKNNIESKKSIFNNDIIVEIKNEDVK